MAANKESSKNTVNNITMTDDRFTNFRTNALELGAKILCFSLHVGIDLLGHLKLLNSRAALTLEHV